MASVDPTSNQTTAPDALRARLLQQLRQEETAKVAQRERRDPSLTLPIYVATAPSPAEQLRHQSRIREQLIVDSMKARVDAPDTGNDPLARQLRATLPQSSPQPTRPTTQRTPPLQPVRTQRTPPPQPSPQAPPNGFRTSQQSADTIDRLLDIAKQNAATGIPPKRVTGAFAVTSKRRERAVRNWRGRWGNRIFHPIKTTAAFGRRTGTRIANRSFRVWKGVTAPVRFAGNSSVKLARGTKQLVLHPLDTTIVRPAKFVGRNIDRSGPVTFGKTVVGAVQGTGRGLFGRSAARPTPQVPPQTPPVRTQTQPVRTQTQPVQTQTQPVQTQTQPVQTQTQTIPQTQAPWINPTPVPAALRPFEVQAPAAVEARTLQNTNRAIAQAAGYGSDFKNVFGADPRTVMAAVTPKPGQRFSDDQVAMIRSLRNHQTHMAKQEGATTKLTPEAAKAAGEVYAGLAKMGLTSQTREDARKFATENPSAAKVLASNITDIRTPRPRSHGIDPQAQGRAL